MSDPIPGTRFSTASFAPVAVADRNGTDESLHHGAGVVIDARGVVVRAVGDPELPVFPRSSLKPFQASAMVRAGLDLPARLLGVVASSHSGEAGHLAAVQEILDLFDLSVEDLANTPDLPVGTVERERALRQNVPPSRIQQNCSGKHAGMLATCRVNGWPTDGYLDAAHPLQTAITTEIDRLAGRSGGSVVDIGIDGCGAPTHVMPLVDMARALATLQLEGSVVTAAMAEHPHLVGGTNRLDTTWMESVPGLVAKDGAAGMLMLGFPDGRSGAVKIADGSAAARAAVTAEMLRMLDVDVDDELADVRDRLAIQVLGHGKSVGAVRSLAW